MSSNEAKCVPTLESSVLGGDSPSKGEEKLPSSAGPRFSSSVEEWIAKPPSAVASDKKCEHSIYPEFYSEQHQFKLSLLKGNLEGVQSHISHIGFLSTYVGHKDCEECVRFYNSEHMTMLDIIHELMMMHYRPSTDTVSTPKPK